MKNQVSIICLPADGISGAVMKEKTGIRDGNVRRPYMLSVTIYTDLMKTRGCFGPIIMKGQDIMYILLY